MTAEPLPEGPTESDEEWIARQLANWPGLTPRQVARLADILDVEDAS